MSLEYLEIGAAGVEALVNHFSRNFAPKVHFFLRTENFIQSGGLFFKRHVQKDISAPGGNFPVLKRLPDSRDSPPLNSIKPVSPMVITHLFKTFGCRISGCKVSRRSWTCRQRAAKTSQAFQTVPTLQS